MIVDWMVAIGFVLFMALICGAAGFLFWLVLGMRRVNDRLTDQLMALVDKEAVMVAASAEHVRATKVPRPEDMPSGDAELTPAEFESMVMDGSVPSGKKLSIEGSY